MDKLHSTWVSGRKKLEYLYYPQSFFQQGHKLIPHWDYILGDLVYGKAHSKGFCYGCFCAVGGLVMCNHCSFKNISESVGNEIKKWTGGQECYSDCMPSVSRQILSVFAIKVACREICSYVNPSSQCAINKTFLKDLVLILFFRYYHYFQKLKTSTTDISYLSVTVIFCRAIWIFPASGETTLRVFF